MEKMIRYPLKRAFICAMSVTVAAVVCLSALTLAGCYRLRKLILPDSNEAFLDIVSVNQYGEETHQLERFRLGEETSLAIGIGISAMGDEDSEAIEEISEVMSVSYTVEKINDGYSMLSPRRKAAYHCLAAAMFLLPLLYSVTGIVTCAAWFYRKKLDGPIRLLSEAAGKIAEQDLDFEVSCANEDEMGLLCRSFEEMRQALYRNNRELWGMVEDRRTLMASVAHDLRNPISIMEGYLEYLQAHIPDGSIDREDILKMVNQTAAAAARLERYTDCLRDLNYLEEQELQPQTCELGRLLTEMAEDFVLLGQKQGLTVETGDSVQPGAARLDGQVLYRILENMMANAVRFAKSRIRLAFERQGQELFVTVCDDGGGFPEALLTRENRLFYTTDRTGEHMGMGLTVCEILARKHGGRLSLRNLPEGGAAVTVSIALECVPHTLSKKVI